jgi:hypothetical protein
MNCSSAAGSTNSPPLQALWQGWKVNDHQWFAWLDTWAQARPTQHRETTSEWRDVMAEAAS